jgi:hypothetical protein
LTITYGFEITYVSNRRFLMKKRLVFVIMAVLIPAIAAADCVEGIRPAKPQERAFYEKISAELHRLILPAPEGCRLSNASKPGSMNGLCGDEKVGQFSIEASQTFFCVTKSPEPVPKPTPEARKISAELDQLSRLPADVSRQKGDLMNQAGQKRKAALQAEKKGNKEQYQKLWAESRALYDEADKLVDVHWKSVAPRKKELEEKIRAITPVTEPASGDIILNLTVNEQHPKDAEKDETVILIGPGGKAGPSLKVKNVRIRVSGIPSWREKILQLVDRSKLEALIGK